MANKIRISCIVLCLLVLFSACDSRRNQIISNILVSPTATETLAPPTATPTITLSPTPTLTPTPVIVVENMDLDEVKTATVAKALKAIGAGNSSLIVLEDVNKNAELSARNIKDVKTALVNTINVLDILKYDSFVATKAAVEKIEEVYK